MKKSYTKIEPSREWAVTSTSSVYSGFYKVEKLEFQHSLFNGGKSQLVDREQFVRGNVVGVIAHDPKLDRIALVEQFRIGARNRDEHPWLIEVIAGMIEPLEQPQEVAIRETYEEAGIRLTNVKQAMRYLASPGSSTEEVFIFYGEADLSSAAGVFGLAEEGEDILLHVVNTEDAFAMMESGKICNAISIIALQWFRHSRMQS
ncbi:UNVERIFIED_CONTAM: hypothetical protein GTU68_003789 [Idotea baltica]|nr:hypothetical protein [Idotea baltica]